MCVPWVTVFYYKSTEKKRESAHNFRKTIQTICEYALFVYCKKELRFAENKEFEATFLHTGFLPKRKKSLVWESSIVSAKAPKEEKSAATGCWYLKWVL